MTFIETMNAISETVERMTPQQRSCMLAYLYGRDPDTLHNAICLALENGRFTSDANGQVQFIANAELPKAGA